MDITELKSQIMHNDIQNLYIFTGTEYGIQKIYIEQIAKVLNKPIVRADCVNDIYSACTSKSLFGDESNIYVIRDDMELTKHEDFYENLSNKISNNVIILLYTKIDSRLKFGKYFKDSIVVFDKLAPNVLKSYIKKVCPLNENHLENLSNKISGSYDLALLEAEKIMCYCKSTGMQIDKGMDVLLNAGVLCQMEETDVFEFTDLFMRRRVNDVMQKGKMLLDSGTPSINILGTLYNTIKTTLLIQICEDKDICGVTGLDSRQVYFNKKYVNKYSDGELVTAMKSIADVVSKVKSGKIDDSVSLYYIVVNTL